MPILFTSIALCVAQTAHTPALDDLCREGPALECVLLLIACVYLSAWRQAVRRTLAATPGTTWNRSVGVRMYDERSCAWAAQARAQSGLQPVQPAQAELLVFECRHRHCAALLRSPRRRPHLRHVHFLQECAKGVIGRGEDSRHQVGIVQGACTRRQARPQRERASRCPPFQFCSAGLLPNFSCWRALGLQAGNSPSTLSP